MNTLLTFAVAALSAALISLPLAADDTACPPPCETATPKKEMKAMTGLVARADQTPMQALGLMGRRDPAISFLLSVFIPGAGQVNNGQTGKGVIMFTSTLFGGLLWHAAVEDNYERAFGSVDPENDDGLEKVGAVFLLGGWLWSIIDAPISAGKINEQNRLQIGVIQPSKMNPTTGMILSLSF